MLRFQAAGHLVGNIVQLPDRGLNQHAVLLPDGAAVEILGERGETEAGLPGEILHCCCHGSTS